MSSITYISTENKNIFHIVEVTDEGEEIFKLQVNGPEDEIEITTKNYAESLGIPYKKRFLLFNRESYSEEDRVLYLSHCFNVGKKLFLKHLDKDEIYSQPLDEYLSSSLFTEEGKENFISGWKSEYNLTKSAGTDESTDKISSTMGFITQIVQSHVQNKVEEETPEKEISVVEINDDFIYTLSQKGIIVDLYIAHWRGRKSISSSTLGFNSSIPQVRDFISKYVSLGQINLIPKEIEYEIDTLESKARALLISYSTKTPWGYFINATNFKEWHQKNEEIKNNFYIKGKSLADNSQNILVEILRNIEPLAQEVYTKETGLHTPPTSDWLHKYRAQISNTFPTAKAIIDSFVFNVTYAEIPIISMSKWTVSNENTPLNQMRKTILESDSNILPSKFYKDYMLNVISDLESKVDTSLTYLKNKAKFSGKTSLSLNLALNNYLSKKDDDNNLPDIINLNKKILNLKALMSVSSKNRDNLKIISTLTEILSLIDLAKISIEAL